MIRYNDKAVWTKTPCGDHFWKRWETFTEDEAETLIRKAKDDDWVSYDAFKSIRDHLIEVGAY